jgi:predicted kinase
MKKLTVTLMCGVPGSGKSTWIKNNKKSNVDIISLDEIRRSVYGHQYHKDADVWVIAFAKSMAILLLKQNRSIIVDATNVIPFMRNAWRDIADQYGAVTELVLFDIPLKVCKQRNAGRSKDQRVPNKVIERFAKLMTPPSKYETYDKIIHVKYRDANKL